ncbi:urease beta subunit [Rhodobium orientis]|nr:hypothetical protein [Rhodobium orientis]MBB4305595.1 urease beta subunit [Rhodobium orientis]
MIKTTSGDQPALKMVNSGAAAIDIGSTMHMAAVNPNSDDMPVRNQTLESDTTVMAKHTKP